MRLRARTLVLCLGAGAGALLAAGQLLSACVFDFAGDCMDTRTCKGTVSSSSSGSGGTAGAGGSGCKTAADCPGPGPDGGVPDGGVCVAFATCTAGKCGLAYIPGPATDQPVGTCTMRMCQPDGQVVSVSDDSNVYDAGPAANPCDVPTCADGGLAFDPMLDGGTCPAPSATSVQGRCVAGFDYQPSACAPCVSVADCATGYDCSSNNYCVVEHCVDGVKDDGETGIDCGGTDCPPCGTGQPCAKPADCQSGVCTAATEICAAPLCGDNVKNGGESDVDCGGPCMTKCNDGEGCFIPSDCKSQVCAGGLCQTATCTDGIQNGTETGVDCGDPDGGCPPCPLL